MKILSFKVLDKTYGLNISQVKEVIRLRPITPIPDIPSFIKGIISLRANIVPIVSLRGKFGLSETFENKGAQIIICYLPGHQAGIIVDRVINCLDIKDEFISGRDDILKDADYLKGVADFNNELILIIDIERLLDSEEQLCLSSIKDRVEVKRKSA
jgi:purine-binding chemotaxis protein CheW